MSEISKQALAVENSTNFPNNNTGYITPTLLRAFNTDMIDSLVDEITYQADSASWNSQITALEAFTSSQQPAFTSLNAFTASQNVVNTNLNAFTQSAGAELDSLSAWTGSIESWTSSINQIQSNGTSLGYSTRFNLVGPGTFFSASIVDNVDGPIATLTFSSDGAKLNTSSFNDYTASVSSSQAALSASVSQSIYALNQYTASEESQINPFTASVNAYTASNDAKWDNIAAQSGSWITESETGSFAILAANQIFTGNNTITGNTVVSQSATYGTASFYGPVNFNKGINSSIQLTGSMTVVGNGDIFLGGDPYTVYNGIGITQANNNYALVEYGSSSAILNFGVVDANSFSYSTELLATATRTGIVFEDFNMGNFTYNTLLTLPQNTGANPAPVFNRGIVSSGSFNSVGTTRMTGSLTITGSVYQNVNAVTIASSTASIDLSKANYFTLTLSGATNINVTNPRPGVTATLVINTDTGATASFSSNVKQPSGSLYVASPSGNVDIISFTSVNTSTVYAFPAQSFV